MFLGFRCSVTFVNNVFCACREQFPPLSLLEHLPFEAPFFLSSEDQETRKRISLNSFHCPCEEYSWRKCDELCDVRARARLLRNALSSSSASTEHLGSYYITATSGAGRNDRNTSGQRENKFNTSYGDISVVVAESNSVVRPKCEQYTSLNYMWNNFSKVLMAHLSFTAILNNAGIGKGIGCIRKGTKKNYIYVL